MCGRADNLTVRGLEYKAFLLAPVGAGDAAEEAEGKREQLPTHLASCLPLSSPHFHTSQQRRRRARAAVAKLEVENLETWEGAQPG